MRKLLIVVRDVGDRMNQNSFRGNEDIFTLKEERENDEIAYIVPKPHEEYTEIEAEYVAKGWTVKERTIFA